MHPLEVLSSLEMAERKRNGASKSSWKLRQFLVDDLI
jgi:hypothetical protein